MDNFLTTLINVAVMLAYGLMGYLLLFFKKVKKESIASLASILMYICASAMAVDAFQEALKSGQTLAWDLVKEMLIFFAIITIVQIIFILGFFMLYKNKFSDAKYRIYTIAGAMSNCAFFGIPLIKALLPDSPRAVIFSCVYFISMNLLGWTLVSAIITQDKKYISVKKAVVNPAIISTVIALLLFGFKIVLPTPIDGMVSILGKMTTPLCMLVIGMRLATVNFKELWTDWRIYLAIGVKQIIMPLVVYLIVFFLPLTSEFKIAAFVFSACPVAAVVLNYAEMLGEGQETACKSVILGTLLSIVTLPILVLLVQFI